MSEKQIKLEILKIAAAYPNSQWDYTMKIAKEMYKFVNVKKSKRPKG